MDHKDTNTVDLDLLFSYFNNTTTADDEAVINEWLKESENNEIFYNNARNMHEAFLMQAPIEVLEGRAPESSLRRRKTLKAVLYGISIAAAVAFFCVMGYDITVNMVQKQLAETMNTIVVPAGQRLDYTLADGTVIKLNSGAKLQYPMAFAKDCREVHLDGEAYFDVEHDAEKPFIVKTFASDIEVLGTEFNVNADEEAGTFSATLVEGSIRLSNSLLPGEHIIMHPNEKVTLVKEHMILKEYDADKDVKWMDGYVDISGLEFRELMKKVEKAFGVRIVIQRDIPSGVVFDNGKLRINDGIDKALGIISKSAHFTYKRDHKTQTIYIE